MDAGTASRAKSVRSQAGKAMIVRVTNIIQTKSDSARLTRANINILSGRIRENTRPPISSDVMAQIITTPVYGICSIAPIRGESNASAILRLSVQKSSPIYHI